MLKRTAAEEAARRDPFGFNRTGITGEVNFATFGCKVFKGDPRTPDKVTPDVVLRRAVHTDARLTAPDGRQIRFWGFADPASAIAAERGAPYPSPTIRVREGQIVHNTLTTSKGPHTIHHHGIEPTTMNDGVGHVSFEVGGGYTYQWKPAHAGTWFYHCHRNTVLHFEMGMLGLLIVDPPEGTGYLYSSSQPNAPYQRYQVEKHWVVDDVDPRWHETIANIGHDAGLCGENVGLNRFEPKYFLVTGVFNNRTLTDPKIVATAKLGETILIRLLNASYSVLRTTFEVDVAVVACDGHRLGKEAWNSVRLVPKGTPIELTTAGRYDILVTPAQRGTYPVTLEFLHWVTRRIQDNGRGVARTKIVVT
jgi:FtsP/CotA-like multicopper oxidase with cupredoxin domain